MIKCGLISYEFLNSKKKRRKIKTLTYVRTRNFLKHMISLKVKYVKELIVTFNPGRLAIQRNLMGHRPSPGVSVVE